MKTTTYVLAVSDLTRSDSGYYSPFSVVAAHDTHASADLIVYSLADPVADNVLAVSRHAVHWNRCCSGSRQTVQSTSSLLRDTVE